MSEVITSITIDAPPEKVWEVVMVPHRFGDWVTIHRGLATAHRAAARATRWCRRCTCAA